MVPSNSEPLPFICLFRVHLRGCEWKHAVWWVAGMFEVIFAFYKYQSLAFSTFNDMTLVFWHPSVKKEWPKPYRKIKICHTSKSRGICLVLHRTGSKIRYKRSCLKNRRKAEQIPKNHQTMKFHKASEVLQSHRKGSFLRGWAKCKQSRGSYTVCAIRHTPRLSCYDKQFTNADCVITTTYETLSKKKNYDAFRRVKKSFKSKCKGLFHCLLSMEGSNTLNRLIS